MVLTGAGAKADADAARARVAKAVFMVAVSLREYGAVLMKKLCRVEFKIFLQLGQ